MAGKEISKLNVSLTTSLGGFAKGFVGATKHVQSFVGSVASAGATMLKFTGIGAAIGGAVAAIGGLGKGFTLASDFEQASVAMETMLGSADAAKRLMTDLSNFAAATPFQMPELVEASKKLVAFGVAGDQVLPTLRSIGDIASGVGVPVAELAELYGKAKVQGRLFAEDINQLTGRGIPIIQELAKQFGVAENEVKGLVESGQINFSHLQKSFMSLTAQGGKFGGMMEKQSQTLGGLMSSLGDTVDTTLREVAQAIIDAFDIKGGVKSLTSGLASAGTSIVAWVQRVAPIIKSVALTIYNTFSAIYSTVAPIVSAVFGYVYGVVQRLLPVVMEVGQGIVDALAGAWQTVYDTVAPIVTAITNWVTQNLDAILQGVIGYFNAIYQVVAAVLSAVWDFISAIWDAIVGVWTWGMDMLGITTQEGGNTVNSAVEGIGGWWLWLLDKVTYALNVIAYSIKNWRLTLELVLMKATLSVVRFANDVAYFFTDTIPAYLSWFGRNWKAIFVDLFNFTWTVFKNLAGNIVRIIKNIPKLITGQVSFSELWTPLTEGFQKTMEDLPDIPERQKGELEAAIEDSVNALEDEWSGGLAKFLEEQEKTAKKGAEAVKKALTPDPKGVEVKVKKPEIPKPDTAVAQMKVEPDVMAAQVKVELKTPDMILAGSAESKKLQFKTPDLIKAATAGAKAAGGGVAGVAGAAAAAAPGGAAALAGGKVLAENGKVMDRFYKDNVDELRKHTGLLATIAKETKGSKYTFNVVTI